MKFEIIFTMKNLSKLIFSAAAMVITGVQCEALEVVYPKNPTVSVNASSTFFVGSTTAGSTLTINSKPVKVWENGSFVEVVTLHDGENDFVLESTTGSEKTSVKYSITKPPKSQTVKQEPPLEEFGENEYIYALVLCDHTPLRARPDENGARITHLDKDTVLMINGKKGSWYRVVLSPDKTAWVAESKVINHSLINEKLHATVCDVVLSEDKNYEYIKSSLDIKAPFSVKEVEGGLELEIFGVKNNAADSKIFKPMTAIKNLAIATAQTGEISKYFIELNQKLWGYDCYYDGKNLVLKIRKEPKIDEKSPLKGIVIGIDPGHGGCDSGAVGPTGVKEKEINLDVARRLKQELEKSGAQVVMTRTDDTNTPLYERPKMAKDADALVLISLHANALPDGADPYKKHGTSVFYYNNEAKLLAKTLQERLIADLGTTNDGFNRSSFVLTRPTMPLCVLLEVAYMIHPTEYMLMLDENFRQKAAVSIKSGLEKYLIDSNAKPVD